MEKVRNKVKRFPSDPGVYLMVDGKERVLYVGKAKNLKKRVSSYFRATAKQRALTKLLIANIRDVRFIVTTTEKEALLLERDLIRQEKPKYNITFKDDKDYLSLRLSIQHRFPRLTVVRRPKKDGAVYFGPYASGMAAKKMARYLYRLFPLRCCCDSVLRNRSRPCLLYQINLCTAPCVGHIDQQAYGRLVGEMRLFLSGKRQPLLKTLYQEMETLAEQTEYEKAAWLRDRIQAIETSVEQQHVVFSDFRDLDVIGLGFEGDRMALVVMTIRAGKTVGKREVLISLVDEDHLQSMVESVLIQHYLEMVSFVPPTILLPITLSAKSSLEELLASHSKHRVRLLQPKKGPRRRLVDMANLNATSFVKQVYAEEDKHRHLMDRVKTKLKLQQTPKRVEAYDISNIGDSAAVGAQVTFINGKPEKSLYRKYRIKTVAGANDFAMIQEVLQRRFRNVAVDDLPDLLVIDGGKGQLNAAVAVLQELAVKGIAVCSLAKDPDRVFLPNRKNPLALKPGDTALLFLQRLRDEVHRFAIGYHRQTKRKQATHSLLTDVPGIGKERSRKLLRQYGAVETIKKASLEELQKLPYLDKKSAAALFARLRQA